MILRLFFVVAGLSIASQVLAVCLNTENKSPEFMKVNQKECLKQAHFLLPTRSAEKTTTEKFQSQLTQPPGRKDHLINGSIIHCRFVYQEQNGTSAKFRCARTNEKNQLFDSRGGLVAEAMGLITEDGDGDGDNDVYLTDASGQKIMRPNKKGEIKPLEADVMKVRYQLGDDRNLENYTSSAASRIFWALGIPAHSNYMTEKVVCFGCSPHPFGTQKKALISNGQYQIQDFIDASIEVKYKGKRIYSPTEHAWKWEQLNDLHKHGTDEIKTEIDVFALASQFLGAIGATDMQNAMVCAKFSEARPDECEDVIAMSHDVGAAFGVRRIKKIGILPRGDLKAFNEAHIFKPGTCRFSYSDGGKELPDHISRKAQQEFLQRAQALSHENLKTIMVASHMGHLKNQSGLQKSSDVEDQWVLAIENKLREIREAPCE